MPVRALSASELEALLTPAVALQAAEQALNAVAKHVWHPAGYERLDLAPQRLTVATAFEDTGIVARFERAERSDLVSLFRPAAHLIAVMPWAPIERARASAVSALATRYLANEEAPCLAVVGTGTQARLHVKAITRVRNVKRVLVVGRTDKRSQEFAAELARELGGGMSIEAADIARACSLADVLCLCTNSRAPVLLGNEVKRGCHINAIGATTFDAREVDTNAVLRAKVVLEDHETGFSQAGDLRIPVEEGRVKTDAYQTDLPAVVTGKRVVRTGEDDITLFKSVGHPAVDFYFAVAAYEEALKRRVGEEVGA